MGRKEWVDDRRVTAKMRWDDYDLSANNVTKEGADIAIKNWHKTMSVEDFEKFKEEIL